MNWQLKWHNRSSKDVQPAEEFLPEDFEPSDSNKTEEDSEDIETSPASKFDRSSNSGAFRLEAWTPDAGDVIPPGDISDLIIVSTETSEDGKHEVSLEFTNTGDDLDVGQVHSLDLRISRNKEQLIMDFESGIEINETFIVNGSLMPLPPGQKSSLTVKIPEHLDRDDTETWSMYFAIKGKDETGNASSKFNVATATFGIKVISSRSTSDEFHKGIAEDKETKVSRNHDHDEGLEDKSIDAGSEKDKNAKDISDESSAMATKDKEVPHEHPGNSSFKWWPIAVGVGVAITVIMVVVLISVLVLKKTRMKTYFSVQSEQC